MPVCIDDVPVEQLRNPGLESHQWPHAMLNKRFTENVIPKEWRHLKITALFKPGKDSVIPKSYRPISLICHTYTLYEQLILNRKAALLEDHLIYDQTGFRPGKSCTSQLLNLTQHIEDGYQRGFVDLSAAYDTVNQPLQGHSKYAVQEKIICSTEQRA